MVSNRYILTTTDAVAATDNDNVATGNQSQLWGGASPNADTGATGNVAAGNGLTNIIEAAVLEGQCTAKIVRVKFEGDLIDGHNYLRIDSSAIGNYPNKTIIGVELIGISNLNATEGVVAATPSLIEAKGGRWAVVEDAIIIVIPDANVQLYQDKILNIRITLI